MSTGALDRIRNGFAETDFDMNGKKFLNADISNLVPPTAFGVQAAHTIFGGPALGSNIPTFRLFTADEVGAQPQDAGLDLLSGTSATAAGISLLEFPNPGLGGYVKNTGSDFAYLWELLSPTELRTDIGAQPLAEALTTLAALTPTSGGQNLLTVPTPATSGFLKISNITGTVSVRSSAELISDLGIVAAPFVDSTAIIKGSADAGKLLRIEVDGWAGAVTRVMTPPDYDFTPASIASAEALLNKIINGLTLSVGEVATEEGGVVTYDLTPAQPYQFSVVSVAGTGGSLLARITGPTDVVFPVSGKLATVATTIPISYLDVDKTLGGAASSNTKVASQKATKDYVDAHVGVITPVPTDTVASATTVDLSVIDDYQITVTGTTDIETFILDEGISKLLIFDDELALIASAQLLLPGNFDLTTQAGDYAIVLGGSTGDVKVLHYERLTGPAKQFAAIFGPENLPFLIKAPGSGLLNLQAHDINISDPIVAAETSINSDAWFGVNHIYFGIPFTRTLGGSEDQVAAPPPATLGYFLRSNGTQANITMDCWGNNVNANVIELRKFRGTPDAYLPVASGDTLGSIKFEGSHISGPSEPEVLVSASAEIIAAATQNFTSGAHGTSLTFKTTLNGEVNSSERMSFGGVTGQATFANNVAITGKLTLTGALRLTPVAFAAMDAAPAEGMLQVVNNSSVTAKGATVDGTGANLVLAMYVAGSWIVV